MSKKHFFFCKLHRIAWPKFKVKRRCFGCKHLEHTRPVIFAELKK